MCTQYQTKCMFVMLHIFKYFYKLFIFNYLCNGYDCFFTTIKMTKNTGGLNKFCSQS